MVRSFYEGHISDRSDIPLYHHRVRFDRNAKLPLYRYNRGTNSFEGGIYVNTVHEIGTSRARAEMAGYFLAKIDFSIVSENCFICLFILLFLSIIFVYINESIFLCLHRFVKLNRLEA